MAARVNHDDVVFRLECAGDRCPAQAIIGEAMCQHDGRLLAAGAYVMKAKFVCLNVALVPRLHVCLLP
jgi:hypothetical protein